MEAKAQARLYYALANINDSDNLKPFVEWLEEKLEETTEEIFSERDEAKLRMLQGSGTAIRTILDEIKNARLNLRKVEETAQKQGGSTHEY